MYKTPETQYLHTYSTRGIYGANRAILLCMTCHWPDPISFVADIIAIIGIPTLRVAIRNLYKDVKKAREPQTVSHGCLEFADADDKTGINLVPLTEVAAIPRHGDTVLLPGEYVDHKNYDGGVYKVESVVFSYLHADPKEVNQPCPALPSKITINVRNMQDENR